MARTGVTRISLWCQIQFITLEAYGLPRCLQRGDV